MNWKAAAKATGAMALVIGVVYGGIMLPHILPQDLDLVLGVIVIVGMVVYFWSAFYDLYRD